jgi:hypothetical protein
MWQFKADHLRAIDQLIDYFGDSFRRAAGVPPLSLAPVRTGAAARRRRRP